MYVHFFMLHVAITILVNPSLITEYLDYAQNLLKHFVISFSVLFMVKNILLIIYIISCTYVQALRSLVL